MKNKKYNKNITLQTSKVFLAEELETSTSHFLKIYFCDFGRNGNGFAIDRDTAEEHIASILNQPLVGKIITKSDSTVDFSGHNVSVETVINDDGTQEQVVTFDSSAFGSCVEVGIEEIDGEEVIVGIWEVWKRFRNACNLILKRVEEGTLHTSWELLVESTVKRNINGLLTNVATAWSCIGHCLLGSTVPPAYSKSGVLSVASQEYHSDIQLAESLLKDILEENSNKLKLQKGESGTMAKAKLQKLEPSNVTEPVNPVISTADGPDNPSVVDGQKLDEPVTNDDEEGEAGSQTPTLPVTSALTMYDLRRAVAKAIYAKNSDCWVDYIFPTENIAYAQEYSANEFDYLLYHYSVENDTVSIIGDAEPITLKATPRTVNATIEELEAQIAQKDEVILSTGTELTNLRSQLTELSQYKDKFEKAEQEKIQAQLEADKEELISTITKSGHITREEIEASEELTTFVNQLDKKSLMAEVAERLMKTIAGPTVEPTVEVSEAQVEPADRTKVNLFVVEQEDDVALFRKTML